MSALGLESALSLQEGRGAFVVEWDLHSAEFVGGRSTMQGRVFSRGARSVCRVYLGARRMPPTLITRGQWEGGAV